MTMAAWKWGNPENIIDRLRSETAKNEDQARVNAERYRIKKARRIRKAVRQAIGGGK